MVDFQEAISVAIENAGKLIQNAKNFSTEGVLISDDNKLYEVSLSYDIEGKDPLATTDRGNTGLYQLAKIMLHRREYKVFLIDKYSGEFRGFKNQNNR
jgi:hypothetical protein